MSSTPRLRSGYPATPVSSSTALQTTAQTTPSSPASPSSAGNAAKSSSLPLAPENISSRGFSSTPVIPLTVLDAPQQRLYAFALYALLWAWKAYDWLQVVEHGDSSWWLFLKWIFIDFAFLFGLPELRIPWLELSQAAVTTIYTFHLILNYMLMFNIPLPWQAWLLGLVKVLHDRELSISEHRIRISNIVNNHSLIMGKQIINILPEGSAVLNPERQSYCMTAGAKTSVALPIHFNATIPAEIELVCIDLDSNTQETIKVSNRDISRIAKSLREQSSDPDTTGFTWQYQVKKPGVYRLGKVLDEYKLEVQIASTDTYIVPCPRARIRTAEEPERCTQYLSELTLDVFGTPPLKLVYRRTIRGKGDVFHLQSLQPDGFMSPLLHSTSSSLVGPDDDFSWVRPSKISVALNESMGTSGEWEYSVEEVHDAFGNIVSYADAGQDAEQAARKGLAQRLRVKDRPKVRMHGCDLRRPIKVAKGQPARLPVSLSLAGVDTHDVAYDVRWTFSPIDSLTKSGDHGDHAAAKSHLVKNSRDTPVVSEPGLYTLKSVTSASCQGEVDEPSSCLLLNPLQPQVSIRSEDIPDKCAGNSVGLRVNMDLVGTPPFTIKYQITTDDDIEEHVHRVSSLRSQLELVPRRAGRYKYVFTSMDDAVYVGLPLYGSDKVLEQVVKPAASAVFMTPSNVIYACLDTAVEVNVDLSGDPPFNLEWEVVYDGKRKVERVDGIDAHQYKIRIAPLSKGGEYILALSSIDDKRGCRNFLQDQLRVSVRRQRPRGSFGLVEQKHSIKAVESDTPLRLPLRLQGEAPWTISYRNLNESAQLFTKVVENANDHLLVKSSGTYEITDVVDSHCPGVVDTTASRFTVAWFPQPQIFLIENDSITSDADGFVKKAICEGDADGFETKLQGSPPYHVEYEIRHRTVQGSQAVNLKSFDAALPKAAITMDATKAGDYTYRFFGLADNFYNNDKSLDPLVIHQRVNAKPSAAFIKPGQSFKYCMEEQANEDKLPVILAGTAPFSIEVEIKHQTGSPPETFRIAAIGSNSYGMPIPRKHLRLGTQQLRIRKVGDANGCERSYGANGPSIQVQLYDAPAIYPLESRDDFCVGERIAYTLSGTPPFDITYNFDGKRNGKSETTSFVRVAERPGVYIITSVADKASECRAEVKLHKTIHPLPSVQISRGQQSRVDIHEGGEVDILFDFQGTPPFEFTYTRSTNAKRGERSVVLETRHEVSSEHSKVVKASQEGTYEVVAIKDRYCSFSKQQVEKASA